MKKRIISVLTVCVLVFALTGCAGKASDAGNTGAAPNPANSDLSAYSDLTMKDYKLVFDEEFDGKTLDRSVWNVELHEPGWVNEEWQEYVDSEENIYLEDGHLVLKPVQKKDTMGSGAFTSGRVNTMGKHEFKYGFFESRLKVPAGNGFLPAFWLMTGDEQKYGQWPVCGEIDIMEVLGDAVNQNHGTIHFGLPHKQDQGTYQPVKLTNFSTDYHTYGLEWMPGKMVWYVDGVKYHETSDWYSKTESGELNPYPAPFNHEFYIILNLAVGNNWAGYPDETTDIKNSEYDIDYVRVYQAPSYDENVQKPVKVVDLREPADGSNYVNNGSFTENEDLSDNKNWKFLLANGGKGEAVIEDGKIVIKSEAAGTEEYSVQLVQPDMPMKEGSSYKLSFKAWADEDRTMKTAVTAPNEGWIRYLEDTEVKLTKEPKEFTFDFTMSEESDPKGRVEFNMGKTGSTATIYITDVSLVKTKD
ncbi:MAG: family 16 glycosylhydrolase [Lachnospiraceae bacterium]|nr:family 16 glycosylhydrolase [Lachnospiraceae bacterium]